MKIIANANVCSHLPLCFLGNWCAVASKSNPSDFEAETQIRIYRDESLFQSEPFSSEIASMAFIHSESSVALLALTTDRQLYLIPVHHQLHDRLAAREHTQLLSKDVDLFLPLPVSAFSQSVSVQSDDFVILTSSGQTSELLLLSPQAANSSSSAHVVNIRIRLTGVNFENDAQLHCMLVEKSSRLESDKISPELLSRLVSIAPEFVSKVSVVLFAASSDGTVCSVLISANIFDQFLVGFQQQMCLQFCDIGKFSSPIVSVTACSFTMPLFDSRLKHATKNVTFEAVLFVGMNGNARLMLTQTLQSVPREAIPELDHETTWIHEFWVNHQNFNIISAHFIYVETAFECVDPIPILSVCFDARNVTVNLGIFQSECWLHESSSVSKMRILPPISSVVTVHQLSIFPRSGLGILQIRSFVAVSVLLYRSSIESQLTFHRLSSYPSNSQIRASIKFVCGHQVSSCRALLFVPTSDSQFHSIPDIGQFRFLAIIRQVCTVFAFDCFRLVHHELCFLCFRFNIFPTVVTPSMQSVIQRSPF
jgi:hypothetical protein